MKRANVVALAIPALVIGVPLAALVVLRFEQVPNPFVSVRATALVFGTAIVALALAAVLLRFARPWVTGVALTAVALVLVGVLVVPGFRTTRVVEERTDLADARASTSSAVPMLDVAEPMTPTTSTPAAPVHVSTGMFVGIDHRATGAANAFREPDGRVVIELLDIDIQPGPDYFVYVVPGAGREAPDDASANLGALKGAQGTQYYDVPSDFDATEFTVLIWCRAFVVPVAAASQMPV